MSTRATLIGRRIRIVPVIGSRDDKIMVGFETGYANAVMLERRSSMVGAVGIEPTTPPV